MQISDYTIREKLYQGSRFAIYRAARKNDTTAYVLKVLDKKSQIQKSINAAENEYRLLAQIDSQFVIKAIDWIDDSSQSIIALTDIGGTSLKECINAGTTFSAGQFLELAVSITDGLAAIHSRDIIHKDINSNNIIWNPKTNRLNIIDFDISSTLKLKVNQLGNPEKLHGTLPYLSPEQTGRMNHRVDWRSDLYSLGITFYEMLTGKLPFQQQDPMELVHAHLARMPQPPSGINKNIPEILSGVIMKLLAKNPEERYQSSTGLKHDLEQIQNSLLTGKDIPEEFKPGQNDISAKLHISEKLYGREDETRQLLNIYSRVTGGSREIMLVSGLPGVGKTTIVNEIHKPITRDRGHFISGKFDQLHRNIPYYAFIQAFNQFCDLLLTERQEILDLWKERILNEIGSMGKVLTDIIPNLALVIGQQPDVPQVEGDKEKNRFHFAFRQFIQAISTKENPLVIFIDDLQWADSSSLDIITQFMSDPQTRYLLLIGAYRDNEVSLSHPLTTTVENLEKAKIPVSSISLKNLTPENVRDWLNDTLKSVNVPDNNRLAEFSNLVYQKTQGNAFFIVQFLHNQYIQKVLRFDFKEAQWAWDIVQIKNQNITDNVADLLVRKIKMLPSNVQEILIFASCIGHIFDLQTLSIISQSTQESLAKELETAIIGQLIIPFNNDTYKFVHDRVHQTAYSLVPDEDRKKTHLKIGRLLLKSFDTRDISKPSPGAQQQIFEIVKHLNIGIQLIEDENEKLELARLNLKAGQKVKASAAYQHAYDCFRNAISLLPPDSWSRFYDLTLTIYSEAIQACHYYQKYDESKQLGETVLESAIHILDKSTAYEFRIMNLMAQGELNQIVDVALKILSNHGLAIPKSPKKRQTALTLSKTKKLLREKGEQGLADLPSMSDPGKLLYTRIYLQAAVAIVLTVPALYPFIINKLLSLSLEHGAAPETPYILTEYGFLDIFQGKIKDGCQMGDAALTLLDKVSGHESMKVRLLTLSLMYIDHWKHSYQDISAKYVALYQRAINAGDLEYAAYNLVYNLKLQHHTGTDLSVVLEKGVDARKTLEQIYNHPYTNIWLDIHLDFFARLTTDDRYWETLRKDEIDIDVPGMTDYLKTVSRFYQSLFKMTLGFLFEDYIGIDFSQFLQNAPMITGVVGYIDYNFFSALTQLQLSRTSTGTQKEEYIKNAGQIIKTIKKWAQFNPMNFQPRYCILQAEFHRVTGKTGKAGEYYSKAIKSASDYGHLFVEAIANELAAKFHMHQTSREELAEFYLQKAWQCYRKWGASAKVKHLEDNYPKFLKFMAPVSIAGPGTFASISTHTSDALLDIRSILKASQALSGEVQVNNLLKKMLQILIENAGAQRGVLIENKEGRLYIQAEGNADGDSSVYRDLPAAPGEKVPLSVINYVAHCKQTLVFDNVSKDLDYSSDNYIQEHQTKSVVCCPIIKKNDLSGIIYLENNRIEGAFTPARIEVLNMLTAQIKISIENAELYENLEEKVKERTIALQEANNELKESNKKINDSVYYASRIQYAVLPGQDTLSELLPRHFIFYSPCSTVSGDFYWIKQVGRKIIVTAADCTGHGVPGALLSMLGMAFLNEIVPHLAAESDLVAGTILDQLRTKIKTALKQSAELPGLSEGMDIALCIIDPVKKQLQFSGAHNPLYIIRDNKLTEVKGDRMPISLYRKEHPFATHELPYRDGDMIYLFTDGYADQLGGAKHEKFKKKNFRNLLVKINQEPMDKQKDVLIEHFDRWKGDFPQVDDILIFGIRL